jgi:hypothetical protein
LIASCWIFSENEFKIDILFKIAEWLDDRNIQ